MQSYGHLEPFCNCSLLQTLGIGNLEALAGVMQLLLQILNHPEELLDLCILTCKPKSGRVIIQCVKVPYMLTACESICSPGTSGLPDRIYERSQQQPHLL